PASAPYALRQRFVTPRHRIAQLGRSAAVLSRAPELRARSRRPLDRAAEGRHEDRVLAPRVGREEGHDVVVVEGEAGGAEALRVGGQIEPPTDDPGLEVGRSIAAIAQPREDALEIGEEEDGDR